MTRDILWTADAIAFEEIWTCLEPLLFSLVLSETNDAEVSRDLVEQTLRRLKFGVYMHENDLVGWAVEIAARLTEAHRMAHPLSDGMEDDAAPPGDGPNSGVLPAADVRAAPGASLADTLSSARPPAASKRG